ncbi:hypothetical protein DVH05_001606 [Phytophthora capsici]|nr:hypothetical protein DVH05_001606 [Phytophthora capsici]
MDLERNHLDELLLSDADEDHDENVEIEDTQAPPLVEPPEPNEVQFEVDDVAEENSEGPRDEEEIPGQNAREGVTDCSICGDALDGRLWVCDRFTCRQPYHRECVKPTLIHDPRCSNCRFPVNLEVEDDEVLVVRHVPAPPKCVVCNDVITGIVLEGTQCSHTLDYNCLRSYNARFFNKTRSADFLCPVCRYPFPCQFVDQEDADEEEVRLHDDNAFEYEGPPDVEEARRQLPEEVGSDSSDSADEYHASDFNSASDDSDTDYDPNQN